MPATADQSMMNQLQRLRNHLRRLARGENGMALPTAIFATIAAFGLGSAAVVASVDSQRGTSRDQNSKEAIAAADAGANVALLRLNRYANALNTTTPCLGVNGTGTLFLTSADSGSPGWCSPVTGTVGTASYSYRVTAVPPLASEATMTVVATGITGKVSRRIAVSFKGTSIDDPHAIDGLIGQDGINLVGNADIHVNIGTNGNVTSTGNAVICGNIRHGVGKEWNVTNNHVHQCSGYGVTEGNVSLPPVSSFVPSDIATNNSNYRLTTCTKVATATTPGVPTGCQSDTFSGDWKNSPWDPTTRTISLNGKEKGQELVLTLGGSDYFICKLELTGGHLIMASESHVRIFFDTPEHCGLSAGTAQISVTGNGTIEATGYEPETGHFDMPGLYLLGSPTIPTKVQLAGNGGTNELVVYGPSSNIEISGNANYIGTIIGKTIDDSGNGSITQPSGYESPKSGGATVYSRQSYVECTGASASPPNAGC
jgi:hypothetical protein